MTELDVDSSKKLVKNGSYLFLHLLISAVSGWVFWLVVARLTTAIELGFAITVISFAALIAGFLGLGLEYSLLREVARGDSAAIGTLLLFEILLLTGISPVIYVAGLWMYGVSFAPYLGLGVLFLILSGMRLVTQTSVLAILESRWLLVFESIGTSIRFGTVLILLALGIGGVAIVAASILQTGVVGVGLLGICYWKVGIKRGGFKQLSRLLRAGLSNFPGQLGALGMVSSLSVVLLAMLGDVAMVGAFFIAVAISSIAGGLATGLATMVLPVSGASDSDHSLTSLKLGMSLTVPLLAGFIVAPEFVLSLMGPTYVSAAGVLRILSIGMIPWIVYVNAVAKMNYLRSLQRLAIVGSLHVTIFVAFFLILAPIYGGTGAALAILFANIAVSFPATKWLGKNAVKLISSAILAAVVGYLAGFQLGSIQPLSFVVAILLSTVVLIILKALSVREIISLGKILLSK